MHYDLNYVKENREALVKSMQKRGIDYPVDKIIDVYEKVKELRRQVDGDRHRRNEISEDFRKQTDEDRKLVKTLKKGIEEKEKEIESLIKEAYSLFQRMPNILDDTVPIGKDDSENISIKKHGEIRKLDFIPKGHEELAENKDLIDMERAAKITGSRFYYLKGKLVILDMALQRYVMDKLMPKGYTPIVPPFMMNRNAYEGVTSLQDFEEVLYKVSGKEDTGDTEKYMIATSEHPLAAMYMNEDIPEEKLPLKYIGISQCFRREAGSHGKDTKGIFRVHQFNKVEQFMFCKPEDSASMHEELLKNAEEIYQELGLPYRVVNICTGDIGIIATKKYDIEGYMYSQDKYKELVSCSNCTDWQSRRLNIKYVDRSGDKKFLHTLNSTAISQRPLVAILEAYQQKDGSIKVPEVLVKYTGFDTI
jgi:seryl-tRNA synthetase